MRERERHPFLDNLVFGLALALFLFLLGVGIKRLSGLRDGQRPSPWGSVAPVQDSGTERAVPELPSVRIVKPGESNPSAAPVPAPGQR